MSEIEQEIYLEESTKLMWNKRSREMMELGKDVAEKAPKIAKTTETIVVHDENPEYEAFLKQIVVAPFPRKRRNCWGARENYDHNIESTDSWKDRQFKNLEIFSLKRLSVEEIIATGRATYRSIHGRFTPRAIARLLLLAYNLRDRNGNFLMAKIDPKLVNFSATTPIKSVPNNELCRGSSREMLMDIDHEIRGNKKATETMRRQALAYTYLGASWLRLFTKHVDNVKQIDKHLKDKFANFYKFKFPFNDFHADQEVIKQMRMEFDLDPKYKNTLYVILFAGRECKEGHDLKEFLYQMHLNYTGLHTYVLWTRVLQNLRTRCAELTESLYRKAFEDQIDGISVLMSMEHANEPKHRRHMWKFARIFDKNFMSVLEVKNCRMFALALAYMVTYTAPHEGRDNPLVIAVLKDCNEGDRFEARAIAESAITHIKSEQYGALHADAAKARLFAKKRT